ncbi:MAG: hypothetical protein WCJ46_00675 [bacterium]
MDIKKKVKEEVARARKNVEKTEEKVKEKIEASQRLHHRPFFVTVICLIGFTGIILGGLLFALLLSPMFQEHIKKYAGLITNADIWVFGLTLVIELVALYGFWDMRRWGVWLYLFLFIADAAYFSSFSGMHLAFAGFIYPGIVIAIGLVNIKKMRA